MNSHTTEGLMQLVSEFGQCRWSEGTYGASFIAKGQERGQREEAAKLYEEIRSYATALCQQGEILRQAREFIDTVHDGEYGYSECTRDELVEKIDAALSTSEGKTE